MMEKVLEIYCDKSWKGVPGVGAAPDGNYEWSVVDVSNGRKKWEGKCKKKYDALEMIMRAVEEAVGA